MEELKESSLSRIYSNLNNTKLCMIAISADRSEYKDSKIIKERQKDLEHDIKLGKFGFIKIEGGYTENKGTKKEKDVVEKSFLVTFSRDRYDEALSYFTKLAKKYEQEEILVVKDKEASYFNNKGELSFKLGEWHPSQIDAYFTKLKNGRKFSFGAANISEGTNDLTPTSRRWSDHLCKCLREGIFEVQSKEEYEELVFCRRDFLDDKIKKFR